MSIGDSYPLVSLPHIKGTVDAIKSWLCQSLPSSKDKWSVNLTGLPIGLQDDSSSCGVAAVNVIHRLICNDVPTWSSQSPRWWRTYYFMRCVEVGTMEVPMVSVIVQ